MVTICTASLTFNNSKFCPHSVFMCFVWIWEQTAIISLYSINWLVFTTETECVPCAVRTVIYLILACNIWHAIHAHHKRSMPNSSNHSDLPNHIIFSSETQTHHDRPTTGPWYRHTRSIEATLQLPFPESHQITTVFMTNASHLPLLVKTKFVI